MSEYFVETQNMVEMDVAVEDNNLDMDASANQNVPMTTDQTTRIIEAISPSVDLTRIEGGVKITVVDKYGTEEATIYDGADGSDGQQGPQGETGATPAFSIGTVESGDSPNVTLTGTNENPVLNFTLKNGVDGTDGQDGADGEDGVSPSVAVTTITGGHQVSITDSSGTETFDVMDGTDGTNGTNGQDGQDGTSAYVHIRYAANEPTQDSDMKTTPDQWMGVYSGTSSTAPTAYTSYAWNKVKGDPGQAGNVYGNTIDMSSSDSTKVSAAIGAKADKVTSATNGNFAALDSNGNLTDSGHKHSDYYTKVTSPTNNNFPKFSGSGLADSGLNEESFYPRCFDVTLNKTQGSTGGGVVLQGSEIKKEMRPHVRFKTIDDDIDYLKVTVSDGYLNISSSPSTARKTTSIKVAIALEKCTGSSTADSTGTGSYTYYFYPPDCKDISGKLDKPVTAGTSGQVLTSDGAGGQTWQTPSGGTVTDVQEDGTSILSSGVANILTMTGAGSSSAGTKGLVPAPTAGQQNLVLTGAGSWQVSPGAKLYTVSGTMTGTTLTISDNYITADMKCVLLELGTPSAFNDKITVTTANGSVTISCTTFSGSSTVTATLQKVVSDPLTVTSTEFDVLNNRIGDLTTLTTTAKTSAVSAINEVNSGLSTANDNIANILNTITHASFNGTNQTWKGGSYHDLFTLTKGKWLVICNYGADVGLLVCRNSSYNYAYGDAASGGCVFVELNSSVTIQVYANAADTNNHTFYRPYFHAIKLHD